MTILFEDARILAMFCSWRFSFWHTWTTGIAKSCYWDRFEKVDFVIRCKLRGMRVFEVGSVMMEQWTIIIHELEDEFESIVWETRRARKVIKIHLD